MVRKTLILTLCFLSIYLPQNLRAAESPYSLPASEHVEVTLISEVISIQPGTTFWVAIQMQMAEGWHTYWRHPGDSGLPTQVEWQLPDGLTAGQIEWPIPEKFTVPEPLITFGYEGEIDLLIPIKPDASLPTGQTVTLEGDVIWLECREICIPGQSHIMLDLPVKSDDPELDLHAVQQLNETRKRLPVMDPNWRIEPVAANEMITLQLNSNASAAQVPSSVEFFPYQASVVENTGVQLFRKREGGFDIDLKFAQNRDKSKTTLEGVLASADPWLTGGERALYVKVPFEPNAKKKSFFAFMFNRD